MALDLDGIECALNDGRILNPTTIKMLVASVRELSERCTMLDKRCEQYNEQIRAMAEAQAMPEEQKEEIRKQMVQAVTTCSNELAPLHPANQAKVLNAVGILLGHFKPE